MSVSPLDRESSRGTRVTVRRPAPRPPGRPSPPSGAAAFARARPRLRRPCCGRARRPLFGAVADACRRSAGRRRRAGRGEGAGRPAAPAGHPLRRRDRPRRRRIEFTPGGRVTVGFRPRAGDAWEVGGRAPRALPAGSLRVASMLAAASRCARGLAAGGPQRAEPRRRRSMRPPSTRPTSPPPTAHRPSCPDERARVAADGTRLRRQVFGFLPYWEVSDAVPRLRAPLDHRLLQRRRRQARQPPEDDLGRHADDRLGRLDQLADDLDHQRRPREPAPASC